ncbi:MAG: hypothetical protein KAI66_20930, partial [Lentisphaeria bacterium]|nr:hypothetical protein [Lentisphaeria bacterium]
MRKQRNNVSRMPWDHRRDVCRCLVDGATYAEVREALTAAGEPLVAHDRSLQAYQKCDEYRKYADLARGYRE